MSEERSVAPSWAPHEAQGQEQAMVWRSIEEFDPKAHPREVLTVDVSGDYRVAAYQWPRSSRSPAWWASVPGRWAVSPTKFAIIPPPPSAAGHIPSELAQDGARTHSPNVERGER